MVNNILNFVTDSTELLAVNLTFQKGVQAQNSGTTIRCKDRRAGFAEGLKCHDLLATVMTELQMLEHRSKVLLPPRVLTYASQ